MKRKEIINEAKKAGLTIKNIDNAGNVRFVNSHSVGNTGFEPDYVWVAGRKLKAFFASVRGVSA